MSAVIRSEIFDGIPPFQIRASMVLNSDYVDITISVGNHSLMYGFAVSNLTPLSKGDQVNFISDVITAASDPRVRLELQTRALAEETIKAVEDVLAKKYEIRSN